MGRIGLWESCGICCNRRLHERGAEQRSTIEPADTATVLLLGLAVSPLHSSFAKWWLGRQSYDEVDSADAWQNVLHTLIDHGFGAFEGLGFPALSWRPKNDFPRHNLLGHVSW
jgi:hypothetical protein